MGLGRFVGCGFPQSMGPGVRSPRAAEACSQGQRYIPNLHIPMPTSLSPDPIILRYNSLQLEPAVVRLIWEV